MKNIVKTGGLLIGLALSTTSCNKTLDELTLNENKPNNVPASLLFTGILNDAYEAPNGQYEAWDQYYLNNYDYYGNNRYDFGSGTTYYTTLKNVGLMEQQALAAGSPAVNPYEAMGNFFRAYLYTRMSLEMGDIPQSQALQGLDALTPVYDQQKAVFVQAFKWLESANADLTTLIAGGTTTLSGDIYFGGDLRKWQKVVNTLRVRLLLNLSKKNGDADLNIAGQFASIVSNPTKYPLMTSSADNMQYTYVAATNNFYPNNNRNFGQDGSRKNMSATYVGLLTSLQDPRVFATSEPARDLVDNKKQSPTDFASFVGADPGLDLGVMYVNAGLQQYSFLNRKRYFSTLTGEPTIQIGYPELEFNIAEGINRGWLPGANAEPYYTAGIQASMAFYGLPTSGTYTAYFYRPGSTDVTASSNYDTYNIPVNYATYYAQPGVKYADGTTGLTQILQQKYLALFRHSGLEAYYNYRRTGVPNFTTGPGTGNGGRIALRFKYPTSERTANTTNYQAALASQYGGNDDINGVMYILK
ncbi:SusD/RagB family nutrient-binding outer membrane lipoprotein [Hymenobacter ginsengisoli]|uniref:SusD/RagB family nutrient-binding outer membrane lipoprotein n=1 Tax=Hymenobacter ginsengisoli TaxID=1051626 RepID=A0ABP8QAL2_9BACT|nr:MULTISPECIES: SusD/RagB family nutrient-binding outer membrane lipoprotein [unclassified Hymenobacter]MBO2031644.1 SusD/RagB family nutrient-binding outer membrane lipoprotein [Hymenobacter sp. BT559]